MLFYRYLTDSWNRDTLEPTHQPIALPLPFIPYNPVRPLYREFLVKRRKEQIQTVSGEQRRRLVVSALYAYYLTKVHVYYTRFLSLKESSPCNEGILSFSFSFFVYFQRGESVFRF